SIAENTNESLVQIVDFVLAVGDDPHGDLHQWMTVRQSDTKLGCEVGFNFLANRFEPRAFCQRPVDIMLNLRRKSVKVRPSLRMLERRKVATQILFKLLVSHDRIASRSCNRTSRPAGAGIGWEPERSAASGELLVEMDKAKGGQPHQKSRKSTGAKREPVGTTLAELGITKKQSSQWQRLAAGGRRGHARPRPAFFFFLFWASRFWSRSTSFAVRLMISQYPLVIIMTAVSILKPWMPIRTATG